MPELPDLTVYLDAMSARIVGEPLQDVRIVNPFVLRSVDPPVSQAKGRRVIGLDRIGKRIVIALEDDLYFVIHLMIAGRLRWRPPGKSVPRTMALAHFDFSKGSLVLTEAGKKRRASLYLVRGKEALTQFHRGGIEVLDATLDQFAERLRAENHTIKRSLADPRLFSGIGNAYSDEILHRAKMSPMVLTSRLKDDEIATLFNATRTVLLEWIERLRAQAGDAFPEKVTAFRDEMAVHGRYGKPCPVCETKVQRIRYADNETNYCPRCQTGGRLLADRALSRLLKDDFPRSIDELED